MNWGNRLLLAFIVFGAGMFFLVYRSVSTRFELVENDYYKQELRYQQVIDGKQEAGNLSASVTVSQTENGIQVQLPEEMKDKKISGEVWFYCAYDERKDRKFNLETDTNAVQSFTPAQVHPGNYTVKIRWADEQNSYYTEKSILVL